MGRAIELGLNKAEYAGVPDIPDTKPERPDFAEIGAERLAHAKERIVGFKNTIKNGLFGFMKRAAATPEMASHVASLVNEKTMDIHTKAGEMKDSFVDAFENKVIAGGEFVGRQYETVTTAAVNGYRGLENRSITAYTAFSSKVESVQRMMRDRKIEKEYQEAKKNLAEARERFARAEMARGQAA